MKGFLPYILIFANFACFCIAEFFPGFITYKQLALFLAFVSVIIIISGTRELLKLKHSLFLLIIILFFICFSFYITGELFYQNSIYGGAIYHGELLAVLGQTTPLLLVGVIYAQKERLLVNTKKATPWVAIIFTIISFFSALNPSYTTSGGFALDENGMNYQNISYMAAFASTFTLFYLVSKKEMSFGKFFDAKIVSVLMVITIILNFFTVLIAGGRGALVLFVIQLCTFMVLKVVTSNNRTRMILRLFPIVVITLLVGVFIVNYVEEIQIESSGFGRIMNFLKEKDDSGRRDIRRVAFESIKESPIIGHGVGSSMFIIGKGTNGQHIYCHNFFIDAMVETGIIGTSFLLIVLIKTFQRIFVLIKKNLSDCLWLIILLNGFVMSMFSGYYLAHLPIAWSIGFALSKAKTDNCLNQMSINRLNGRAI